MGWGSVTPCRKRRLVAVRSQNWGTPRSGALVRGQRQMGHIPNFRHKTTLNGCFAIAKILSQRLA
ncbi:hypothetical protein [Campylobacter lanienae]|uniref:hypothetical protein n=1 Tax=Campylobacter lanienae TaxID=75658 RepID=UPI00112F84B4|nr:hypothetical protein [Campylobacter lanienae]